MDNEEIKRRKEAKNQFKAAWKDEFRKSLPADLPVLQEFMRRLDQMLSESDGCDHSLAKTEAASKSLNLEPSQIVEWVRNWGGYCDCEVIYNVDEKVDEISE